MIPIGEESLPHFRNNDYFEIFMSTLHMAVPAAYCWLLMFFQLFHVWTNLLAEITYFADRRFY